MSKRLSNAKMITARTLREPSTILKHMDQLCVPFGLWGNTTLAKGGVYRMFDKPTSGFYSDSGGVDRRYLAADGFTGNTAPWGFTGGNFLSLNPANDTINRYGDYILGVSSLVGSILSWGLGATDLLHPTMANMAYTGFREVVEDPPGTFSYGETWWGSDPAVGLAEVSSSSAFLTGVIHGAETAFTWHVFSGTSYMYTYPFCQMASFNYNAKYIGSSFLSNLPAGVTIEEAWCDVTASCTYTEWVERHYAMEVVVNACDLWGIDYAPGAMTVFGGDWSGWVEYLPKNYAMTTTVQDVYGASGTITGPTTVAEPTVRVIMYGITPDGIAHPLGVSAAFPADGEAHRVLVTNMVNEMIPPSPHHMGSGVYRRFAFGICSGNNTTEADTLPAMLGDYTVNKVFNHWSLDDYNTYGGNRAYCWTDGYKYEFDCSSIANPQLGMGNLYVKLSTGDDMVWPMFGPPINLPAMG